MQRRPISSVVTALSATSRRTRLAGVVVLIALVIAIGLAQSSPSRDPAADRPPAESTVAKTRAAAPAPLRRLYEDGGKLLRLDGNAFVAKMKRLEGYPVLINKWASWCRPCRREFTLLRRAAAKHGDRMAFLGLNSGDRAPDARTFLAAHPTIYPHVRDPDEQIAGAFRAGGVYPQTLIVDENGDVQRLKPGEFTTEREVEAFIEPYLRPSESDASGRGR